MADLDYERLKIVACDAIELARDAMHYVPLHFRAENDMDATLNGLEEAMGRAPTTKTLSNTTAKKAKDQVPDIEFFGDSDLFKLLGKACSQKEQWMKSTKAMDVPGGVVIQVTTQQGNNVAEALTFIPDACVSFDGEYYKIVATG